MGRKRKGAPARAEADLLEKCRRRCCVCFGLSGDVTEKQGQIAHLDHDSSNDDPDNLAFLCLPHHDQYDSRTSQSKNLTEAEVRRYREGLHKAIEGGVLEGAKMPRILRFSDFAPQGIVQSVQGDGNVVSAGHVNVSIKMPRSRRCGSKAPIIPGSVAEDPRMIGYLRYLADRYEKFKAWDCDLRKERMRYGFIHSAYKREMHYSMVGTPRELFDKAVQYLQQRIRNTRLARSRRHQKLFNSFEKFDERGAHDDGLPV